MDDGMRRWARLVREAVAAGEPVPLVSVRAELGARGSMFVVSPPVPAGLVDAASTPFPEVSSPLAAETVAQVMRRLIEEPPRPPVVVVRPESKRWAERPVWPAPSAEAVMVALWVGSVTLDEAREQGWTL